MSESLEVPESWEALLRRITHETADAREARGVRGIYVLGGTDTGKSTLCRYLVERLNGAGEVAGWLDGDPGQATLGPPTTLGLALREAAVRGPEVAGVGKVRLRFVGSTTPMGHLLPMLVGAKRLAEAARESGGRWLVIDSPGLVAGSTGREFQHQMIELLRPRWLVVLGEGAALERITKVFRARGLPRVRRLRVCEAVVRRTANQRAAYRAMRFGEYFRAACEQDVALSGRGVHGHVPEPTERGAMGKAGAVGAVGRVVALCDRVGEVVVLGIVCEADWAGERLRVFAPPFDAEAVVSVQFGTLRLDRTGREL